MPRPRDTSPAPRPKRIPSHVVVPWVVSLLVHVGIIGIGLAVTWSVVNLAAEVGAPTVQLTAITESSAPLQAETLEPIQSVSTIAATADARQITPVPPPELLVDATISSPVSIPTPPSFTSHTISKTSRFAGLTSENARSVVFVIDASGTMIPYLLIVVEELTRTLMAMDESQTFAIFFFQSDRAIAVPPGRLVHTTDVNRLDAVKWIDRNVIPGGGSNPLQALRRGLTLKPDVIYLLSDDITGSGAYALDRDTILSSLSSWNPATANGKRQTQIKCVQFLDPDPLNTLQAIATTHGGRDGFTFLDRGELGLTTP
jgi:hypothetical protein